MNRFGLGLAALVTLATPLGARQQQPQGGLFQQAIDDAIHKGIEYLRTAGSPAIDDNPDCDELILLTFIHAGVPVDDPKVASLLENVLKKPLERTYQVALLAMCLEEIDRVRYQPQIMMCGQFLIDNMKDNGHWGYGKPSRAVVPVPSAAPRKAVSSGGGVAAPRMDTHGKPEKPKVKNKIQLQKLNSVEVARGDNSNSQYAALGMRACHDAGVTFSKEHIALARQWWVVSQHPANADDLKGRPAVASGGATLGTPRGWCYTPGDPDCKHGGPPYGSMTAGAVAAVCIYDYMLGIDWKKDKVVQDGLAWMDRNWSVTENIGPSETGKGHPQAWIHYYLYAVERVGMLYDTTRIGAHEWYPEGATHLLATQGGGAWSVPSGKMGPVPDTCFAILFLKRATRPMVASGAKK